jgi:hypothetical protein
MITGSCWGLLAKPPSSTSGPNSQDRRHPADGPGASRFRRPGRLEAWPDGGKEGGGRGELGDVLTLERENGKGAGGGSTRRRRGVAERVCLGEGCSWWRLFALRVLLCRRIKDGRRRAWQWPAAARLCRCGGGSGFARQGNEAARARLGLPL